MQDLTIKEIRSFTKLSQRAFAERYHIPVRTIEDWEAGRRNPPPYVPYLLALAAGYIME